MVKFHLNGTVWHWRSRGVFIKYRELSMDSQRWLFGRNTTLLNWNIGPYSSHSAGSGSGQILNLLNLRERPLWYTTKSRSFFLVVNVDFPKSLIETRFWLLGSRVSCVLLCPSLLLRLFCVVFYCCCRCCESPLDIWGPSQVQTGFLSILMFRTPLTEVTPY